MRISGLFHNKFSSIIIKNKIKFIHSESTRDSPVIFSSCHEETSFCTARSTCFAQCGIHFASDLGIEIFFFHLYICDLACLSLTCTPFRGGLCGDCLFFCLRESFYLPLRMRWSSSGRGVCDGRAVHRPATLFASAPLFLFPVPSFAWQCFL